MKINRRKTMLIRIERTRKKRKAKKMIQRAIKMKGVRVLRLRKALKSRARQKRISKRAKIIIKIPRRVIRSVMINKNSHRIKKRQRRWNLINHLSQLPKPKKQLKRTIVMMTKKNRKVKPKRKWKTQKSPKTT